LAQLQNKVQQCITTTETVGNENTGRATTMKVSQHRMLYKKMCLSLFSKLLASVII